MEGSVCMCCGTGCQRGSWWAALLISMHPWGREVTLALTCQLLHSKLPQAQHELQRHGLCCRHHQSKVARHVHRAGGLGGCRTGLSPDAGEALRCQTHFAARVFLAGSSMPQVVLSQSLLHPFNMNGLQAVQAMGCPAVRPAPHILRQPCHISCATAQQSCP